MANLRQFVREKIPFSTSIYEQVEHKRRRRAARSQIDQIQNSGQPIKLDIGGGYRGGSNGWITVDTSYECDLYWDLREGIPFQAGSVDAIYSSHLFEHLTYAESQGLLRECLRALKPGGAFSIAVPNARMYIEGYLGLREIPMEYFGWKRAYHDTTAIDAVNYIAYMAGEHKYMFDQENLVHVLKQAGFVDVRAREFDPDTDMKERDFESIYAIGYKPR